MKKLLACCLVAILGLMFCIGCSSTIEGQPSDSNQQESKMTNAMYKVGQDLPSGEYLIEGDSAYVEVAKDSTGELESIITNDNIRTHIFITLQDGEYFTIKNGKITPIDEVVPFEANDEGIYEEGMYRVGIDMPAGEYLLNATDDNAYVEVDKDSLGRLKSISTNDNFSGSRYITVKEGQYLYVRNATIQSAT